MLVRNLAGVVMQPFLNRKGQTIIELTLITPLLLVALYVAFDFGIMIFTGHIVQNAARDGARIASKIRALNDTAATGVADQVWARLPNLLVEPTKQVTVNYYSGTPANCAEFVEVVAEGNYDFTLYRMVRLFGGTVPSTVVISRTTRMSYEFQPYLNGGVTGAPTFCSSGATPTATGSHT